MITAHSTPATGFPVEDKPQPQYASFDEALAAMKLDAGKVKIAHSKNVYAAPPRHEQPSEAQEKALLALEGDMLTPEVSGIMGVKNAYRFLADLCAKGFVERRGTQSGVTKWRRTRKGCKWVERNRGAGK